MNLNGFIYEGNIIKTLKYILKLSSWNSKDIKFFIICFLEQEKNNILNFYEFTDYLKNNLQKKQITYQFIGGTIFGSIYPNFLENKLLQKYYREFYDNKKIMF